MTRTRRDFFGMRDSSFLSSIARRCAEGLPAGLSVIVLSMAGCASTRTEISGATLEHPLCANAGQPVAVSVTWIPQWRTDQKEPAVREGLAQRGIEGFLAQHRCLRATGFRRLPSGSVVPSDTELVAMARGTTPRSSVALLIVVRELGPTLTIGLPVPVEGATEVLIDVRALDAVTTAPLAALRTSWWNGGPFVVKGIGSLDQDLTEALNLSLMPTPSP